MATAGRKRYDHLTAAAAPQGAARAAVTAQITTAQDRLAAHGFDPGTRSGQLDHQTRTAVAAFQQSQGLPQTGTIDSATHTALHTAPTNTRKRRASPDVTPGTVQPAIAHSGTPSASPTPVSGRAMPQAQQQPQFRNGGNVMARGQGNYYKPTGFRSPVILSATIPALGTAQVSVIPQMDFRGENLCVDPTVVGPNCTLTVPVVGTRPQIAGGVPSTGIPGSMFDPRQCGALDWTMDIANQGNAIQTTVTSTLTATTLNFAALLFGKEVEKDNSAQAAAAGMASAGSFRG